MIPPPKLDDRTYADIVAEAMRLIPRYCPEWTDHNPSDPGITILELAAWMTELILYRLNRVPEKNYLAFLNMIGVRLRPPQPARGLITFELVEGADKQLLRAGMQVSTSQSSEDETVVFETQRDLVIVGSKLDRCFSYYNETYADNSPYLDGSRAEGFEVFAGADRIDRFVYLGDARLQAVTEASVLRLHLSAPEHGGRDMARLLEWEYWNGRRWRDLRMTQLEVDRGEVVFFGPADIQPTTIHGIEFLPRSSPTNAPPSRLASARSGRTPSPAISTTALTVSSSVSHGFCGTSARRPRIHRPSMWLTVVGSKRSGPMNATSPRSTSICAGSISFQRVPSQYSHSSRRAMSRPPRSGVPRKMRSSDWSPQFANRGSAR